MNDYLKLKKSVLNNFLRTDSNTLRVYLYLLKAEQEEIYTTINTIAVDLNLSRQNIKTSLNKLALNNLINYKKVSNKLNISMENETKNKGVKQVAKLEANEQLNNYFDIFWKEYPKKKSKPTAKKEFLKLKKMDSELFDKIIDALKIQKNSNDWKKEEGKYIPYPQKWIKERRWEDIQEVETSVNEELNFLNGQVNNLEF